jgi:hypothetical protein
MGRTGWILLQWYNTVDTAIAHVSVGQFTESLCALVVMESIVLTSVKS